jgi:hypothetical protein
MTLLKEFLKATEGKHLTMPQELILSHIKAELLRENPSPMYLRRKSFFWLCGLVDDAASSHAGLLKVHSDKLEKTMDIHLDKDK